MKYEKFTGIPSLETYNLFSCQEYQESEVAVVSTQLDEDDKSFVFQRLRESRSLSANQELGQQVWLLGKQGFNLAAPRLYINRMNVLYMSVPNDIDRAKQKIKNDHWRHLLEQVRRMRSNWEDALSRHFRVTFLSMEDHLRALGLIHPQNMRGGHLGVNKESVDIFNFDTVRRIYEAGVPMYWPAKKGELSYQELVDFDQVLREIEDKNYE